jgi:hypothetical protein
LGWGASVLLDDKNTDSCPDAMGLAWSTSGRGDYRESPEDPDKLTMWQYTNEGSVPGIRGNVDINLYFPQ